MLVRCNCEHAKSYCSGAVLKYVSNLSVRPYHGAMSRRPTPRQEIHLRLGPGASSRDPASILRPSLVEVFLEARLETCESVIITLVYIYIYIYNHKRILHINYLSHLLVQYTL